jgi:hypothetical protein
LYLISIKKHSIINKKEKKEIQMMGLSFVSLLGPAHHLLPQNVTEHREEKEKEYRGVD